jgi:hypothetical protein
MARKVIITLSFILVIVIGIQYFLNTQVPSEEKDDIDVETFFEIPKLEENLSDLEELELEETLDVPMIPDSKIENEELAKVNEVEIFQEKDKDELLKELPNKKLAAPFSGVAIDKNAISKLVVGSIIKLPNVGQMEYSATITEKTVHKNGSVSVSGNLTGEDNSNFSVVLTEGKNSSFASITTPEGAFQIETVNGIGYIYSIDEIERNYVDPNKEDVLVPEGGNNEHSHNHSHEH